MKCMPRNRELSTRVWKEKIPEERMNDMHRFLVKICEEVGPREPGSEAEHKAANIVKEEFEKYCDKVEKEEFLLAPKGFLSFTLLSPFLVLIGIPLFWIYPIVSSVLAILAMFIFYMQFLRYAEFVDFLYPKKNSVNVIGEINPKKEWNQTLMFSAHLDSAYQFNFNLYMPRTFNYFLIGLPIILIIFILVSLTYFILNWIFTFTGTVFIYLGIGLAVIIVPMATMLFFFKTNWAVLGANDNLSGIALLQGIGETLSKSKKFLPNQTKILLVAFGSEEAGLRGAKNWIKKHKDELDKKPFYFLNFDGVAKSDDLHIIHKEKTLGVIYNPEIVDLVVQSAKNVDIELPFRELPFGATDGSAIVKGGFLNGASIEAMDINRPDVKRWYHTINDTADVVEPEALELVRKLSIEFISLIDKK
ncbi:MAG: M28 family peptidase [Candidatus Heimdallarchaeota archaeon]|nr:M28 family peptidase [Candidatus Heimdallarchaeota archaeon]